eukprot:391607-Pyramimonas_sp.AAC.1
MEGKRGEAMAVERGEAREEREVRGEASTSESRAAAREHPALMDTAASWRGVSWLSLSSAKSAPSASSMRTCGTTDRQLQLRGRFEVAVTRATILGL